MPDQLYVGETESASQRIFQHRAASHVGSKIRTILLRAENKSAVRNNYNVPFFGGYVLICCYVAMFILNTLYYIMFFNVICICSLG